MSDVFLDRDGVINENRASHVTSWSEFSFLPGALEALRLFTVHKFRVFVVTNQACVNRNLLSVAGLERIHQRMIGAARRCGALITDLRYCPHRPDEACGCRKPQPGMLFDLAQAHGIATNTAYLVGDALTDIAAGRAAGCRTILVRTGRGAEQLAGRPDPTAMPDLVADDLLAAARWLCTSAGERRARLESARAELSVRYGQPVRVAAEERPISC